MIVYVLLIMYLFFSWNRSSSFVDPIEKSHFEKRRIVIYVLILSALAALKYIEPGTDMEGYMGGYIRISNMSIAEALNIGVDNPVYYIAVKLFSLTHLTYHFWFAFVEVVYFGSMMLFVSRFSDDKLYSALLSFTIAVFDFSLRGSKQTMAMGIALVALLAFMDKKYTRAVIMYVLAYYCHHASLIFLPAFLVYGIRERNDFWPIVLVGGSAIIFGGTFLLQFVLNIMESEHYSYIYMMNRSQYAFTTIIYYIVIFLFSYVYSKIYEQEEHYGSRFIIASSFLCIVAQSMAQINADFFRLAYYYIPFLIVMPANSFNVLEENGRNYKMILAAITVFYMLYTSRDGGYQFMWTN